MNRYKYSLERRVSDLREHPDQDEYIADTPSGKEVYVRPQDYKFDGERGGKKWYVTRNEI